MAPKAVPPKRKDPKPTEDENGEESKRVEAPDNQEFQAKTKVITDEVDQLQQKLKKLSTLIGARSHGKDEFLANKGKIREQIVSEGEAIGELFARKNEIIKNMKASNDASRQSNMELKNMKKSLGVDSTEQIDERIASIEFRLWTESITLKEEKKLLEEIKQLKKDKPKVANYYQKEAEVKASKEKSGLEGKSMKDSLELISAEMSVHKERKQELNEELKKLMEERQAQMSDMPELFKQRDELNRSIRAKIDERDALRDEHKKHEQAYFNYMRQLREERQEKARQEREQWNKQRELEQRQRRVEKLDEQPHSEHVKLLEQTIKFCRSFQPKEETTQEEIKTTKYDNPDTHVVLKSKGDREEEFYFAPTKKGKAAKNKTKKPSGGASAIKHNAEAFKLFASLRLDAPITTDDIPATLEKLEAEMEKYRQKIKKWEEEREQRKRQILAGEDDFAAVKAEEQEKRGEDDQEKEQMEEKDE